MAFADAPIRAAALTAAASQTRVEVSPKTMRWAAT